MFSHKRYGVEIEFTHNGSGKTAQEVKRFLYKNTSLLHNNWKLVRDVSCGLELVSPPLRGTEGFVQVQEACQALKAAGCQINSRCGIHVHHEANHLTLPQVRTLLENYAFLEEAFDAVVKAGRRKDENHYCGSLKEFDVESSLENDMIRGFLADFADYKGRYVKLNPLSLARHNTLEFRQHHATLDEDELIYWIKLTQMFVVCMSQEKAADYLSAEATPAQKLNYLFDFLQDSGDPKKDLKEFYGFTDGWRIRKVMDAFNVEADFRKKGSWKHCHNKLCVFIHDMKEHFFNRIMKN